MIGKCTARKGCSFSSRPHKYSTKISLIALLLGIRWMEKIDDSPGMISWTPKQDVFPSGFSDWLEMPLAMYAPEYFAQNV